MTEAYPPSYDKGSPGILVTGRLPEDVLQAIDPSPGQAAYPTGALMMSDRAEVSFVTGVDVATGEQLDVATSFSEATVQPDIVVYVQAAEPDTDDVYAVTVTKTRNALIEGLYRDHYYDFLVYADKLAGDLEGHDTEAVVQDALEKVMGALDKGYVRDITLLSAYTYATITRLIRSAYRHKKVVDRKTPQAIAMLGEKTLVSHSAEQRYLLDSTAEELIALVSDNNQPIFRLIALGYSYIEIAQLCNRSVNTIKTIVRREQKRIKVTEAQLSPKASNTPGFDEDDLARIVQFEQDIRSGAYGIKNAARITEQLKPSQQAVWRLYVQGMNKHEIASSLHTDYGKVAWGLYTARCSLLATLKAQDAL